MSGRNKKVFKWLKDQSEALPKETYTAFHKYSSPMWEKMEDGNIQPVYGEAEEHPVNHGRRLKKIFKKVGKKGVDMYFKQRGFKLVKSK